MQPTTLATRVRRRAIPLFRIATPSPWAMLAAAALAARIAAAQTPPPVAVPTNARVFYMPLDSADGSGRTYDTTTNRVVGLATGVQWTAMGRVGGACEFPAAGGYVAVTNPLVATATQWTITVWFRATPSRQHDRFLIDKGVTNGLALRILAHPNDTHRHGRLKLSVGSSAIESDTPVDNNKWRHAAIVADGQRVRLFVDGVAQSNALAWTGPIPANERPWSLGMNRSAPTEAERNRSLDGVMDDLMIFGRALTDEEVAAVRAAARPRFTRAQVEQRLREIKELYDRGLLRQDFYDRKVAECEAGL